MASETTTTSANDIVQTYIWEAAFFDYAFDWAIAQQFCRLFSGVGRPSNAIYIPILDSILGTVGTQTSYDTEFNGTEGTDLSNTQRTTSYVTGSASEVALMQTITDQLGEDEIPGWDMMGRMIQDAARVITLVREDDLCALYGSLTNSQGTSGSTLTIAQALASQVGIRQRGWRAPDGVVYHLHDAQADDLEAAIIASATSAATYATACDRLLNIDRTVNNGMGNGHVMNFRGYPVYASGVPDVNGSAADRVGACFVPSSPGNDQCATFSKFIKRPFRLELQRDASLRATEIVASERAGFFESCDGSGTKIVTDA